MSEIGVVIDDNDAAASSNTISKATLDQVMDRLGVGFFHYSEFVYLSGFYPFVMPSFVYVFLFFS